ncbi:hypothetical protein ACIQWR_32675 [Streptomyces sp. NPDC098789]|uniref:hypothetical protein n=1 Tax=Streptomyces sp. NPDC098789 TaxID=3366098 RepID=UPI0038200C90
MTLARKVTMAVAAAGLVIGAAGAAQASGGAVSGKTVGACGEASGNYQWFQTGSAGGSPLYKTQWTLTTKDNCADGKGVELRVSYRYWQNGAWRDDHMDRTKNPVLKSKGTGADVKDVTIWVCLKGDDKTCAPVR